jgi:gamma-glutamyltranspeptidase/glutathione hydrolase
MLSDPFIAERRSHIDSKKAQAQVSPGPERTSSETIYLTVADKDGNMVSFINSLFDEFGSGIVVPGTGFALHDRVRDSRWSRDFRTLSRRVSGHFTRSFPVS